MEVKKYTSSQYKAGRYNLLRFERILMIKALIKCDWNIKKAFEVNYPVPTISRNAYNKKILRHHISVIDRCYLKFSEIE